MNLPSVLPNSYLNVYSELLSTQRSSYESMTFYSTTKQFYYDYPYNFDLISTSEYSSNDHNTYTNYIPFQPIQIGTQEQKANTIKIHVNPFFRPRLLNQTSESSSSDIEQNQQLNLSLPSLSQSRPSLSERPATLSSTKKQQREFQKLQREKFIREKELLIKRRSSSLLLTKSNHHRSSPDRREHNDERLKRLYQEYSDETSSKHWKPLSLRETFQLCQYAADKHHRRS